MSDTNMFCDLMTTPGGRFRGITNTGQQLYVAADMPYGLNPSVDIAIATLLGSHAFFGCKAANFFHATPSGGCIIFTLRYLCPNEGQHICWAYSSVMKAVGSS
jgi:hypothetical protein